MKDPMNAVMELAASATERFPQNSRYHGVTTVTVTRAGGTPLVYLRRRFVPDPDELTAVDVHAVTGNDRMDNIAAQYLADPELFWRLCDGNGVMRPRELTELVGRVLRITLPEGVPGA